jgi:hypothetical protein
MASEMVNMTIFDFAFCFLSGFPCFPISWCLFCLFAFIRSPFVAFRSTRRPVSFDSTQVSSPDTSSDPSSLEKRIVRTKNLQRSHTVSGCFLAQGILRVALLMRRLLAIHQGLASKLSALLDPRKNTTGTTIGWLRIISRYFLRSIRSQKRVVRARDLQRFRPFPAVFLRRAYLESLISSRTLFSLTHSQMPSPSGPSGTIRGGGRRRIPGGRLLRRIPGSARWRGMPAGGRLGRLPDGGRSREDVEPDCFFACL